MSEILQGKSRSIAIESEPSQRTHSPGSVRCKAAAFIPLLRRTLAGEYLIMGTIVFAACNLVYWSSRTPQISSLTSIMASVWIALRALGVGRGHVLTAMVSILLLVCVCLAAPQLEQRTGWTRLVCSPTTIGVLLVLCIVIDISEVRLLRKELRR